MTLGIVRFLEEVIGAISQPENVPFISALPTVLVKDELSLV
ncbi:hypothetical protein [Thermococcus sp. AM4]|nr:hypothetical protein [Thermococcus sp. AM4]AEO13982.1 hypothetical protein TAM4_2388 [Thermococcus sp. AM4]